jgi:HEAT repeat protein
MNLLERLFLCGGLLAVGAVGVIVLLALGVDVPFLSARYTPAADTAEEIAVEDGLPPPEFPADEEEPGLLDELRSPDGAAWSGPGGTGGAPAIDDGGEEVLPAKVIEALGRDPLVDRLKAGVDVTDTGQVLAFLMATFTENGTKLGEEDLEFLFKALGEQEDFGLRNLLFAHLERIGTGAVTEGVLAFLAAEKNPAAIGRALTTLKEQGDEAAVRGLVSFLAETKNRKLQDLAFKNLLGTKSEAAVEPLMSVLANSEDRSARQYALAALSQIGGAAGAEAVIRYAGSSDPFERSIGTKSLRDLQNREAVPVLADSLDRTTDVALRTNVVRTLGRLCDPRAVPSVSQVALYGENRVIRTEALKSLAQIGSTSALPALRAIAETDENAGMRRTAERTIAVIEKQAAREQARPQQR